MNRPLLVALLLGGCISTPAAPSPAGLQPMIDLDPFNGQLRIIVAVQTRTPIDVSATFRDQTVSVQTTTENSGNADASAAVVWFGLDHPLVADEPVTLDVDGVEMTITAPPPFDDVQVPATIARNQPASIEWATTSPDPMHWMVWSSTCAGGYGEIAPNASRLALGPSDWTARPDSGTCQTDIRLFRDRDGTLDPSFAGPGNEEAGHLRFEQIYDATFTSTPS